MFYRDTIIACVDNINVHGIVAKLKNAYQVGIRIVRHEKVFRQFHLEKQAFKKKKKKVSP